MYALNNLEIECVSGAGFVANTCTNLGKMVGGSIGKLVAGIVSYLIPDITLPIVDFNLKSYVHGLVENFTTSQIESLATTIGNKIESFLPSFLK